MPEQLKTFLITILDKLGFLTSDQKLSITNLAVIVFLSITAFKLLFSGAHFHYNIIDWTVQTMDISETLPLLFSLLNYQNKRVENNKLNAANGISSKGDNT